MTVATVAVATVAEIMAAATVAAATVAEIMAAATVAEIMAAATVAVVTDLPIRNLMLLTVINPLVQKVGKIGAMVALLKTLNLKVEGVGEKEEFPARVILQTMKIRNPFL